MSAIEFARLTFCMRLTVIEPNSLRRQYTDENLDPVEPVLRAGERLHVPVCHDESIIQSNELRNRAWLRDGHQPLRKKGKGRSIHVSGFIVEQTGRLCLSTEQIAEQEKLRPEDRLLFSDSRQIIYPGKNHDGFWNGKKLIPQVPLSFFIVDFRELSIASDSSQQIIQRAIPTFEYLYPSAVAEFFFDQSSAHGAFADDALNAKEMNLNPSGKKRRMHDTIIPDDCPIIEKRGTLQQLYFPDDLSPTDPDFKLRGQNKGLRRVLEERGLWTVLCNANPGKTPLKTCEHCKLSQKAQDQKAREAAAVAAAAAAPAAAADAGEDGDESDDEDLVHETTVGTCCAQKLMSLQKDFFTEKPLLQKVIEEAGHKCYFLPKFHCELNPIEMYWGWVKIREFMHLCL